MKGDFIGFEFNGIHSDTLGLVRVSDGDNYSENLIPEFEDKTIEVPGGAGLYYYGMTTKERNFSIKVMFDHLTDVQFRKIKRTFGINKICPLIFDEAPYKIYKAKLKEVPEISYICYEEQLRTIGEGRPGVRMIENGSGERERETVFPYEYDSEKKEMVYKGEMTLDFISYYPYAFVKYKDIDSYDDDNIEEWVYTARLKSAAELTNYDTYKVNEVNKYINVYNPGDIPSPVKIYVPFNNTSIGEMNISLTNVIGAQLNLDVIEKQGNDTGILINSSNHLIEGVVMNNTSYITTGNVYNQKIKGGDFFSLPCTQGILDYFDSTISFTGAGAPDTEDAIKIYYNYLYY